MTKKRNKKTSSNTKTHKKSELEMSLAKNIIELQKINTDLAEKFDHLAKELSNLLSLFEITARNFAKNAPTNELEKDKAFLEKIDKLLDQNKTIAKGLTLMEERMRERIYGGPPKKEEETFHPSMGSPGRPLPKF